MKVFKKLTSALLIVAITFATFCASFDSMTVNAASANDPPSYAGTSYYMDGKYYKALTNVKLTGNLGQDVANVAASQVGYYEGNNKNQLSGEVAGKNNYTEYGYWFGGQAFWCQIFVSWCADTAGVSSSIVSKTASTVSGLSDLERKGKVYTVSDIRNKKYTPQPGDIVYFKSGKTGDNRAANRVNHTGICVGYSDKNLTLYTVEGNTSSKNADTNGGMVAKKSYNLKTTNYVKYICHPNYESANARKTTYSTGIYKGVANDLKVYASANGSSVIDTVSRGKELEVIVVNGKYGKVVYNDVTGWIDLSLACMVSKYVTGPYSSSSTMNLCSDPSPKETVLTKIPVNKVIVVNELKGGWGKTTYIDKSGKTYTGWVRLDYAKRSNLTYKVGTYKTASSETYLRASAPTDTTGSATTSAKTGVVPPDKYVYVIEIKGRWGYAIYGDKEGWIDLQSCNNVSSQVVGTYSTSNERSVYQNPVSTSQVLGNVKAKASFYVAGLSGDFALTNAITGKQGWISYDGLKKISSAEKKFQYTRSVKAPVILYSDGKLTMSSETDGAVIYYTIDGTNPTTKSHIYSSPISVNKNTTIKAYAVKSGYTDSTVVTKILISDVLETPPKFAVGDKVKIIEGTTTLNGDILSSAQYKKVYEVLAVDKARVSIGSNKEFEFIMHEDSLRLYSENEKEIPEGTIGGKCGDGKGVYAEGIDLSKYDNSVDFKSLKASGKDFVILRLGTSKMKDDSFDIYYNQARAAGLDIGAVLYSFALTEEEAQKDAQNALLWMGDKKFEYPIYLQVEDYTQKTKITKAKLTSVCKAFFDKLYKEGYATGIRIRNDWTEKYVDLDKISEYEVWYAKATKSGSASTDYSRQYGMWRYTAGDNVSGSETKIGISQAYKDYPKLIQEAGLNGYTKATRVATPRITVSSSNKVTITCSTANTSIYYTLTGLNPTPSDTKFTKAFTVTKSCLIKAYAVAKNGTESAVATKEITIVLTKDFKVGDRVCLRNDSVRTYEGETIKKSYFNEIFIIMSIRDDRAVLGLNGAVVLAVNVKDIMHESDILF